MSQTACILWLGCGYVGQRFLHAAHHPDWRVVAASRDAHRVEQWQRAAQEAMWMQRNPAALDDQRLKSVTVIVDSIPLSSPPSRATQPDWVDGLVSRCPNLQQVIYLSSTSVYGDAEGAWVNEDWPCQPGSLRGQQRLVAEQAWQKACDQAGLALAIFRLAGIYGPQRNIYDKLRAGGYRAVRWEPDHYANRIHVDDIVAALCAAIERKVRGVYNISDDLPMSHADYVCRLADHLQAPPPIILSAEEGAKQLSPSLLSFFADNKRLNNERMHRDLCPVLRYPNFIHGVEVMGC